MNIKIISIILAVFITCVSFFCFNRFKKVETINDSEIISYNLVDFLENEDETIDSSVTYTDDSFMNTEEIEIIDSSDVNTQTNNETKNINTFDNKSTNNTTSKTNNSQNAKNTSNNSDSTTDNNVVPPSINIPSSDIGILTIQSIGLKAPVREGSDMGTLNYAVGHFENTAFWERKYWTFST